MIEKTILIIASILLAINLVVGFLNLIDRIKEYCLSKALDNLTNSLEDDEVVRLKVNNNSKEEVR